MGEAELRPIYNCARFALNFNQMTNFSLVRKGGSHEPFEDIEKGKFWGKESDYQSFYQAQLQGAGRSKKRRRLPDFLVHDRRLRIILRENTGNK